MEASVSIKGQPITIHNSNYVSTSYENKAICACFGGCCLPTNGAVLPIPALSTFTFSIFTGSMLCAAGMANTLVTSYPCPSFFTATCSPNADTMGATVYRAHFWKKTQKIGYCLMAMTISSQLDLWMINSFALSQKVFSCCRYFRN